MTKLKHQKALTLFILLFIVVGVFFVFKSAKDAYFGFRSMSWPRAKGVIRYVGLVRENDIRRTRGRRLAGRYRLTINYTYNVDDMEYENDLLYFGYRGDKNLSEAKKLLQKYKINRNILVSYNPDDPSFSVIVAGVQHEVLLDFGLGAIFLVVSWFGLFVILKRKKCLN